MRQRRAPAPITARQIDTFRRELTQRECSPGTVENYVRSVRAFARWNREAPVTCGRAAEWRRSLAETHAPATVNAMLAGLSKFFTLTGREDCRVRPLRLQHRSFRSAERELSRAEYRSLVCTARAEGRERLALLMETVCATGIRVGEVRYITVEAARRGRADIALKGKLRTILLPARLCRRLLKFAGKNKFAFGAIFLTKSGRPLSRTQIWAEMKRLCAKAGVAAEKVFPHNLRHLFARTFYESCRDVVKLADILGHSSVETTRLYLLTTGAEHLRQLERLRLLC